MLATIGKGTGYFTVLRAGYSIPETYPAQAVYVKPSPNSSTNFSVVLVTGQTVLNDVPYSQLTNADTTAAFTSAADFQTYFQTNFFRKAGGTAGNINPVSPVAYNSGTGNLSMTQSSASVDGYLSSTDWSAFNNKASTVSPSFSGNPTATTQATSDSSTRLATTAYVQANLTATAINFVSGLFVGSVNPTTPTPGSSGNPLTIGPSFVTVSMLSATGSPSATTVLYGNNSWAVPFDFTTSHSYSGVQTYSATVTAAAGVGIGQIHTPSLTAAANSDILTDIKVTSTTTIGSFTSVKHLAMDFNGSPVPGSVYGIRITDAAHTTSTLLFGSLQDIGGTFSVPGIWMGSAYTGTPSSSNYIFNLDDGSGGAVINGPGSNNPISFRIGNTTKLKLTTGGALVTVPTISAVNATATLTVAQLQTNVKTTSSTAVTLTLPTATAYVSALGALQGSYTVFSIDNTASTASGAITLVLGAGMTSGLTAGLTVAIGKAQTYAVLFTSASTCIVSQIL